MLELLTSSPEDPERAARTLVSAALDAGGVDNVTVVVVDVKEAPPAKEPHRGDTQEMWAVDLETSPGGAGRRERPSGRGKKRRARPQAKGGSFWRVLGKLVQVLAVVLVLAALTMPFYLWGASRYFLGFDGDEVVVYRGLPYAPLGFELNEEVRRTGLEESEIDARYRDRISEHWLYSESDVDVVVRDLGSSEPTQR